MREALPWWSALLLPPALLSLAAVTAVASAGLESLAAGRRVGAGDLMAPARDAVRLLHVRRRTTLHPDALLWRVGGGSLLVTAVLAAAVVPFGERSVVVSPVSVVWFNAAEAVLWAALWLTGWGANSVSGLVAGYRFLATALAYELPLMLSLITASSAAGSLDVLEVARAQARGPWFVVVMPVAFAVFLLAAMAMSFWGPFGQPSAADLSGGVLAELSGVDRLVVLVGRYAWLTVAAAMAVPLFLGGGEGPVLPPIGWQLVKTLLVLALMLAMSWRWPLVRVDRFEEIAWVVLLPAIILQALVVAVFFLR